MPTPKQVRYHYAKVASLRYKLNNALHEAYRCNVLKYKNKEEDPEYQGHYVCNALEDMWQKFKRATDDQLAEAMRSEIMENIK